MEDRTPDITRRNYIKEGRDLSPGTEGKNPLMEAAKEQEKDADKIQEVQKVGKVVLLKKNPGKDLHPHFETNPPHLSGIEALGLLIENGPQTPGKGADHPEERRADRKCVTRIKTRQEGIMAG